MVWNCGLWIGVFLVRNYGLWRRSLEFRPQAGLIFGPKGPSEAETHDTNTIAISKAKRCLFFCLFLLENFL